MEPKKITLIAPQWISKRIVFGQPLFVLLMNLLPVISLIRRTIKWLSKITMSIYTQPAIFDKSTCPPPHLFTHYNSTLHNVDVCWKKHGYPEQFKFQQVKRRNKKSVHVVIVSLLLLHLMFFNCPLCSYFLFDLGATTSKYSFLNTI